MSSSTSSHHIFNEFWDLIPHVLSYATFRERIALSHCHRRLRTDVQSRMQARIRMQLTDHLGTSADSFWLIWSATNSGLIGSYALWSLLNDPTWTPRDINVVAMPSSLSTWLDWASSEGFTSITSSVQGPGVDHIHLFWNFQRSQVNTCDTVWCCTETFVGFKHHINHPL
jgi:hypothetical protein